MGGYLDVQYRDRSAGSSVCQMNVEEASFGWEAKIEFCFRLLRRKYYLRDAAINSRASWNLSHKPSGVFRIPRFFIISMDCICAPSGEIFKAVFAVYIRSCCG